MYNNNITLADPSDTCPAWTKDVQDIGDGMVWSSGLLVDTPDVTAYIGREDMRGSDGVLVPGRAVLSATFTDDETVGFNSPESLRRAAVALLEAALKFEEALCTDEGRRVMDVRHARRGDGARVYLVTQTENKTGYEQVCEMDHENPTHPEAAALKNGQSWSTGGFRYTLHGLFDYSHKIDEHYTRYIEVI